MKLPFTKTNQLAVLERLGGLDWMQLGAELESWEDGQEGTLELKKKRQPKSSAQLGYYYAVILPVAFEAFKENGDLDLIVRVNKKDYTIPLSKETVDLFLKQRYAPWKGVYKDKADMSMSECAKFEDWAILWLAKYMGCCIPPADVNWRKNDTR